MSRELYDDLAEDMRLVQILDDAEARVAQERMSGVKQTIFWCAVFFVVGAVVYAKLYTMGAIAGLK